MCNKYLTPHSRVKLLSAKNLSTGEIVKVNLYFDSYEEAYDYAAKWGYEAMNFLKVNI